MVQRPVVPDPKQKRPERAVRIDLRPTFPDGQKRLLHQVFGNFRRDAHPLQVVQQKGVVALEKHAERLLVSISDAPGQLGVVEHADGALSGQQQ